MPDIGVVPAVILVGGLATRLRPITESIPKALVELDGIPFIDYQLDLLARKGIRHVVMCVGYLGEMVQRHVDSGARYGLTVKYSYDGDRLMGSGGALRRALPLLDESCWVMYGDSYMDIDYPAILEHYRASGALGLMTVLANENRWDRSNAVFQDGILVRYDKRAPTPDMRHIDYGVALLKREAILRMPDGEPYDLADLYSSLVSEGQMTGHEVTQRFYEIGTPQALAETAEYLRTRRPASRN